MFCLSVFLFCLLSLTAFGKNSKRSDDNGPLEVVVNQLSQSVSTLTAKLQAAEALINTQQNELSSLRTSITNLTATKGSTYVRWGKTQCPSGATTIYSGVAAGGLDSHTGSGANRLCMVTNPVMDDTPILANGHGFIYGAEYNVPGHHITDVICSLCYTSFSTTFIVPGTNRCPDGTTEQYHGYLSVGYAGSNSASEYLCLDSNPEDRLGSEDHHDCAWFDHASIACGSLPCPPYVSGKAATCAVCSK